ncbi:MAG: hypothetical protein SVY53_12005 [Chloroflexota bacterium]|nr:hypothetical protein [Chloroflexota bacterium]
MITPKSYEERVKKYDDQHPGEGDYRPPSRTLEEIAQRDIDIEEHIAIELLRHNEPIGEYKLPQDYVRAVVEDRNYTVHIYQDDELNEWFSQLCDGKIGDDDYSQKAANISLAKLILAEAVVNHRLNGYSGSEHTYSLGFGVVLTTSIAAAIVDYHKRVSHALGSKL